MEFHVSGELYEGAPTKISRHIGYGTWSSCWVEERRARDGWCSWRRL